MKINRAYLEEGKEEIFEEDIDFSNFPFNDTHVRCIPMCHAKLLATDYGETLRVIFQIKAQVTAVCSYTLEDVPLELQFQDELEFSNIDYQDDQMIYEPENIIDMDPHILSLIFARIPIKVVKPGAKLPENGNGYSVMTEEEYFAEKSGKKNSAWDILDTVKLDEDDK